MTTVLKTDYTAGLRAISDLDLSRVTQKLQDSTEGPGWTEEMVKKGTVLYRQFLTLCLKYPERKIAPTKLIDTVWHTHITDTTRYAKDCDKIFGYFLHHDPTFGSRGPEDQAALKRAGELLHGLFLSEFGTTPRIDMANCFSTTDDEGSSHCSPDHDDHG